MRRVELKERETRPVSVLTPAASTSADMFSRALRNEKKNYVFQGNCKKKKFPCKNLTQVLEGLVQTGQREL
jgi:hypothetical protein